MAIRWVPLAKKLGSVDPAQVSIVVQTLTASLSPELARDYVAHRRSLWRHHLSASERASFHEMAQAHRRVIKRILPDDVWEAVAVARPDLAEVLSRDGGRAWLAAQTAEIKVALLQ